ncbi:S8 family peptidase [[Clostridium] fimetarium]|uniref:Subtilase family protein n=1 Tax=[Clostridium] fimetarium TaxID=99656 RepID=A0A1I0M830_9FIRM|nr:S8 family peptidase [[Clostridium] fimetarium]SEV84617.1 Subtilase family protein [[Clostridium] fimetarium]
MNKIISEDYADLIIRNEIIEQYQNEKKDNITLINNKHSMLHLPIADIEKCSLGEFNYNFFPSCFSLASLDSLDRSSVTEIQKNPNLALFGEGVLIGFVDTGIEYQHQAFVNVDKTSRIVSIWDQTINNEQNNITEMPYGTEYDNKIINAALLSDNPMSIVPTTDEIGHGTILAGIAAGNLNVSQKFSGVAPKTELVIVKLKQAKQITRDIFCIPSKAICYQDTDILMGMRYIIATAARLQKPIVLCFGLGTNQGGHDGFGAVSSQLDFLSQVPKVCTMTPAGNEGISRRHYLGKLTKGEPLKEFELNVGIADTLFSMEIWQQAPYRIALDITSPTGEYTAPIYPEINECHKLSYVFESSVLWVNNEISEGDTGDQLILVRFQTALAGIWKFRVYNMDNASSEFNVWLPCAQLITDDTYFLQSNPNKTIISPGNAAKSITITSYNPESGGIAINASRGYTRTNVIKPDLAAPGVDLTCPVIGNTYGTASGTGCATAHTAGIAAMMLEWGIVKGNYTSMNGQDIQKLLIRGAVRSDELEYPNNVWGYGKVNIYNVFQRLR